MNPDPRLLVPRPRHAARTGDRLTLASPVAIRIEGADDVVEPARRRIESLLSAHRLQTEIAASRSSASITLRHRAGSSAPSEGYRLAVGRDGVEISAASGAGLFYGACTLGQWLALHTAPDGVRAAALEGLEIEDEPGFGARGVMLDISRNKVPTMETLFRLVDLLSGWKINQLQLYTEHTFAYAGHEVVWRHASPITPDEIRALDLYCRERCVELVPNQQSFGHLHRWLVHERYRQLAECPDGIEHPFSPEREPFGLCPVDRGAIALLEDLYSQLLPNFTSQLFNVGLDETLDLGLGRSAEQCKGSGRHAVYLDFLGEVHQLAARHGRRIQFWADILLEKPELIDRIPEDAIALNWGYEADHPFEDEASRLSAVGREFYVCPGTSSWNSFGGRAQNALGNLAAAARWGHACGARGYLITDWGDNGHLQPMVSSLLGFLAGAGFAWNPDSVNDPPSRWHRLLDIHAFGNSGAGFGRVVMALANSYLATGTPSKNGSALFHLVASPRDALDHPRYRELSGQGLEVVLAAMGHAQDDLPVAGTAHQAARAELEWARLAIDLGARIGLARLEQARGESLQALPHATRSRLAQQAIDLADGLDQVWLSRNRPGGLDASKQRLLNLSAALR